MYPGRVLKKHSLTPRASDRYPSIKWEKHLVVGFLKVFGSHLPLACQLPGVFQDDLGQDGLKLKRAKQWFGSKNDAEITAFR